VTSTFSLASRSLRRSRRALSGSIHRQILSFSRLLFSSLTSTQALASAPTCYIFPCPPTNSALSAAPLHALVPAIGGREPGLLLVATDGEIRHWDSVASGLAGAEHFARAALPLEPGETATLFVRADVCTSS
jgi:hypothetical protein